MRSVSLAAISITFLASCGAPVPTDTEASVAVPEPVMSFAAETRPTARWDHKPQADRWTDAALAALRTGPGAPLVETVPADTGTWCPGYPEASAAEREAFWVGLVSALAKHESTWRPHVSGGDDQWHGLLQISPATARGYGCRADSAEELKDGASNLRCALRIMASTVPRDGVIAADGGGVAADWAPFHHDEKRADMSSWTRAQSYCHAS